MSDVETRFHETWLGMVQPIEGLVVSLPVLVDAQCMSRQPASVQQLLQSCVPVDLATGRRVLRSVEELFEKVLGLTSEVVIAQDKLPENLSVYVPEGPQTIKPDFAICLPQSPLDSGNGLQRGALVWRLPSGLPFDRPETITGKWNYAPAAKFERLLRGTGVDIGILVNDEAVRLMYAPAGESMGSITFKFEDMCSVGGRAILDAFVMLLSVQRFFVVPEDKQLPALLRDSRKRQANVTSALAGQVFEALELLLRGFEAAASRGRGTDRNASADQLRVLLDDALARDDHKGDFLYSGLLTVLLRLVFLLFAEDRALLPVEHPHYSAYLSVLGLYSKLLEDRGAYPDSMSLRFGAWAQLVSLFRSVFFGVEHGELIMPPRRGDLFDPHTYPFLEGWGPGGSSPFVSSDARAEVQVPLIDDETVFQVLDRLVRLEGQRLSYRALDVEHIGSVYEGLMGYSVQRAIGQTVCIKPAKVWITLEELLAEPANRRAAWLEEHAALAKSQLKSTQEALTKATSVDSLREALAPLIEKGKPILAAGELFVQPGPERRRTSSHYTPRSLSEPIVRKTLDPILAPVSAQKGVIEADTLLSLKICDPAMGSGAFLVEACRYLAGKLVSCWPSERGPLDLVHAQRLVAQRCLYGVDRNPFAVTLAKLSLWLLTLAKDEPFTFLDHALRHGDSLVGLSLEQIRAFHWKPADTSAQKGTTLTFDEYAVATSVEASVPKKRGKKAAAGVSNESLALGALADEVSQSLGEAVGLRQQIVDWDLTHGVDVVAARIKENLLFDATDALDRVRLIGDLVVGAFFAHDKDKDREAERQRRLALVADWLRSAGPVPESIKVLRDEIRARIPVFHWAAEYPEVFYLDRPDPLENGVVNEAAYMDAFVGNPPFAGKNGVVNTGGPGYLDWLQTIHPGAHGNADLSAHFFRRVDTLLGKHGTIGLIATNTIAQGDTRSTGLQYLLAQGHIIQHATRSMLWPGDANVAVSVVHLVKGILTNAIGERTLDNVVVEAINSRLDPGQEHGDPVKLMANDSSSFQGSVVLGMGFTITPAERDELVAHNAKNAEQIFPYLGGEEVNTNPAQAFDRYVISFGTKSLEEAEQWPDLLDIVRTKVKPERDKNNRDNYRLKWWQFGEARPGMYAAIRPLSRCLVTARVSKHLMLSLQPSVRIFSEQLYVFPFEDHAHFAMLQSRVHEPWARLLSSSMRNDLRYSASDCFETFPFPGCLQPAQAVPTKHGIGPVNKDSLEAIGKELYEKRAAYMVESTPAVGLTVTYNRLKDPGNREPRIVELRGLHEEMDRAVLGAYGWGDLVVPPYCPATEADRAAVEAFSGAVIERLFVLNGQRAGEEKAGPGASKKGVSRSLKKSSNPDSK